MAMKKLEHLTFNLKPTAARKESWNGKQWTVVPTVMMTEGVRAGSEGPKLYLNEEMQKNIHTWNMKPIVDYHPEENGEAVSACSPDVIARQGLGLMMNTRFDNKLVTEAWFEDPKIYGPDAIDARIGKAIDDNQSMEVSTGVYVDDEDSEGEYKGTAYTKIARNLRADHLAILPDKKGACSLKDGCGLMTNESHSEIHDKVQGLVKDKFKGTASEGADSPWVMDVWDDKVVYAHQGDLYEHEIAKTQDNELRLAGTPKKVSRVTKYVRADGSYVGNEATESSDQKDKPMPKKELVDALIANEATQWAEGDREALMKFDECTLNKMSPVENVMDDEEEEPDDKKKKGKKVDNEDEESDYSSGVGGKKKKKGKKGEDAAGEEPASEATTPSGKEGKPNFQHATAEEYVNNAPPEIRVLLNAGLQNLKAERKRLVNTIIANKRNKFTEAFLNKCEIDELRGMALLAAPEKEPQTQNSGILQDNYFGQAGGVVDNSSYQTDEKLDMPVMNFDKESD